MNIFDPVVTGSLVVSGSATITGGLTVGGTLNATIQGSVAGGATTGSNTFQGNQTINGDLSVTGNLTAQQYIVSSSVYYVTESTLSGSNTFGNDSLDFHNFTGSVNILGDLKLNGQTALNNDNSHWEWYSKNAKENGLNAVSNETKLNLTSNAISVTAKNNGFYYAVSSGGVCDNVTSESAYILVKKKNLSIFLDVLIRNGNSHVLIYPRKILNKIPNSFG